MNKIFLLSFKVVCCFSACSNHSEKYQDRKVEVQTVKDISFQSNGDLFLVPDYSFPAHLVYQNSDSILFFNIFASGLSSIFYRDSIFNSGVTLPLIQIKNQLLDRPNFFFKRKGGFVFIQNNLLLMFNDSLEFENALDIRKYYPISKFDLSYFKTNNNFDIGLYFSSYDALNDVFYFFSKDILNSEIGLFKYDFTADTLTNVKDFYDKEWVKNQEIVHKNDLVFIIDNLPFLLVKDDFLISTYYSNSKIDVLNTKTQDFFSKNIKSSFLPEKKSFPPKIPNDVNSLDALDFTLDWEKEVAYGEIKYWKNCDCFFRTVKGPSEEQIKNYDVFIQFFDKNFELIQELNLSKFNSNIGMFSLPLSSVLLFKSKIQNSEDNYSFIEVTFNFDK
ncbi:hypothetical protein ACFPIK_17910 [Algoriphagus aquatilis]|uniref:DUF4221 domain-containing protein n=1 Tax=Algoriphagus aquatilis TaxID=490186 RepID=A0ABW0C182_9BACT